MQPSSMDCTLANSCFHWQKAKSLSSLRHWEGLKALLRPPRYMQGTSPHDKRKGRGRVKTVMFSSTKAQSEVMKGVGVFIRALDILMQIKGSPMLRRP